MQKNTLNDVAYWTYHADKTPTIVMIHGFTGSHEGFQYIVPLLSEFRLIIPDLPGFGESPLKLDECSIDALAKAVNQFVAALELDAPPYLVSHSMGGLVAASMLAHNPELYAEKTVFISPVPTAVKLLDSRKIGEVLGRLQYFLADSFPRVGKPIATSSKVSDVASDLMITTSDGKLKQSIYQHHRDNLLHISSFAYYYRLHKDINRRGAIDYASQLQAKRAMVITGDADSVTPLAKVRQFSTALNAELKIIQGVGHLAHYERPGDLATRIARFLC